MKTPKSDIPAAQNDRKKRLADALRQNLQLRKDRARGGNSGEIAQKPTDSAQKSDKK
jgi:hypothetical protein